jgi:general secretion pathway protein L
LPLKKLPSLTTEIDLSQAFANVTAASVWRWWTNELFAFLPAWLVKLAVPYTHILRIAVLADDRFELSRHGTHPWRQTAQAIGAGNWTQICELLVQRRSVFSPFAKIEFVIPRSRCLVLNHHLPVSALARATDILMFEMERTTPFRRQTVLHDFAVVGDERQSAMTMAVKHVIIKAAVVDRWLSDLGQIGMAAGSIRVADDATLANVDLLAHKPNDHTTVSTRLNRVIAAGLGLAACLTLYNTSTALWTLTASLSEKTQEEQALKQQVTALRKTLQAQDTVQNRVQDLKLRKLDAIGTLQVWEEVTQLLPESAWVTDVRLEDGLLHLNGFSSSASELVGIFSRASIFTKVEFSSPVTRDPQQGVERFQLRMKLERPANAAQATPRERAP